MGNKSDISNLEKRIEEAKRKYIHVEKEKDYGRNEANPMRIGVELVSGVVAGLLIGHWLDSFFDTLPIFFIICFFLGVAAGGLNIYKLANNTIDEESNVG